MKIFYIRKRIPIIIDIKLLSRREVGEAPLFEQKRLIRSLLRNQTFDWFQFGKWRSDWLKNRTKNQLPNSQQLPKEQLID